MFRCGATGPAIAAVAGGWLLVTGCQPEKVAAPTSYARFSSEDKSFQCDYPSGWRAQGSTSQGIRAGAVFQKSAAKIDVDADLQGSLMGDIARSSNTSITGIAPGLAGRMKPPVDTLHDMGKRAVAEHYGGYQEQSARTLDGSMGEGRLSEFTGTAGTVFKHKVHGFRVTILGGERAVTVIARCPEDEWKTLQPAFDRVIKSLRPG